MRKVQSKRLAALEQRHEVDDSRERLLAKLEAMGQRMRASGQTIAPISEEEMAQRVAEGLVSSTIGGQDSE